MRRESAAVRLTLIDLFLTFSGQREGTRNASLSHYNPAAEAHVFSHRLPCDTQLGCGIIIIYRIDATMPDMKDVIARFDALDWHDAVLLDISVPRISPGYVDEVVLRIRWPDGVRQTLTFLDCRVLDVHMNFGIIPISGDEICTAQAGTHPERVDMLRKSWSMLDMGPLCDFQINTSSTGSTIQVIARDFTLTDDRG